MRSAMRTAHRIRLASILAVGAFALHQLRYLLAFGGESAAEGHRYMADLLPPLSVLVLAAILATLLRGTEGASPAPAPLARRIAIFAGALLAIYFGQELLEGLMAAGHSANLAALLADGGWVALPLAAAARPPARGSRACDRGGSRRAATALAGARGPRQGPSCPWRQLALRATGLRPGSTAASAGTCLVRCPPAHVSPAFRQQRQRAHAQGGFSRCNRGLHDSACWLR